jgi:uncharacterized damage-inducible protein DinB
MPRMLETLRDLVAHKGHANAAFLNAVRQNEAAAVDPELWELLHHVLLANRFWLLKVAGQPFEIEVEARPSESFTALVERFEGLQKQEQAWLESAIEDDLAKVLEGDLIPNGKCTVAQAWMQVCLHTHGHRSQAAKLLRRHGGTPPATDFILWIADRPAAQWPGSQPERLQDPQ